MHSNKFCGCKDKPTNGLGYCEQCIKYIEELRKDIQKLKEEKDENNKNK